MISDTLKILLVVICPVLFFAALFAAAFAYRWVKSPRQPSARTNQPGVIEKGLPPCEDCRHRAIGATPHPLSASQRDTFGFRSTGRENCNPTLEPCTRASSFSQPHFAEQQLHVRRLSAHPSTDEIHRVNSFVASLAAMPSSDALGTESGRSSLHAQLEPLAVVDGSRRVSVISSGGMNRTRQTDQSYRQDGDNPFRIGSESETLHSPHSPKDNRFSLHLSIVLPSPASPAVPEGHPFSALSHPFQVTDTHHSSDLRSPATARPAKGTVSLTVSPESGTSANEQQDEAKVKKDGESLFREWAGFEQRRTPQLPTGSSQAIVIGEVPPGDGDSRTFTVKPPLHAEPKVGTARRSTQKITYLAEVAGTVTKPANAERGESIPELPLPAGLNSRCSFMDEGHEV